MLALARTPGSALASRLLHTSSALLSPPKVPVALLAALRKTHPVPLSQAREALERSDLSLEGAIAYLSSGTNSARAKADKVAGRATGEGTIAAAVLGGKRASLVHLACETDFVARNDVFQRTARGAADTAAFLDVPNDDGAAAPPATILAFPVPALLSAPLITPPADGAAPVPTAEPQTIAQLLLASLAQTGENTRLVRAASYAAPFPSRPDVRFVPGAYTHAGKVGGLVVLRVTGRPVDGKDVPIASLVAGEKGLDEDLLKLARNVARQVVGFPTKSIVTAPGVEEEETLLRQQAMMLGAEGTVEDALEKWGQEKGVKVVVADMRRWAVGDAVEDKKAR
ncbi:Elongation factor Ts, mitochondrial [Cryptotrichosporon argae]